MSRCLICNEETDAKFGWLALFQLEKEKRVCESCKAKFEKISGPTCPVCFRPSDELCDDCVRWDEHELQGVLTRNVSVYRYNDFMKEVLARYKFRGDAALADIFQSEMNKAFHHYYKDKWIVPIPLSEQRLFERGFNQSELLLSGNVVQALERNESEKQSKKSRKERLRASNVFQVKGEVEGQPIVLVDDIYTTGMTLRMAAKVLKEAGAKEVCSLTLIRS
mgnify:CR=1 FL=1